MQRVGFPFVQYGTSGNIFHSAWRLPRLFLAVVISPFFALAQTTQPEIQSTLRNGQLILRWNGDGALEFSRDLQSPWQTVIGARSPFATYPSRDHRHYRVGPGTNPHPSIPISTRFASRTTSTMGDWWIFSGDDWMFTRGQAWTKIHSGVLRTPPGLRNMAGQFFVPADSTPVAIFFSAETYVDEPGSRLFVRALLDGKPMNPNDVVLTTGRTPQLQGTRSFIFTARVDAGLHTLEMEWMVDRLATGYIRDAAYVVRVGDSAGSDSTLQANSPPSGPSVSTTSAAWENVPGISESIFTKADDHLAIHFSAESFVTRGGSLFLRALVDGLPASPADVLLARGNDPQSRLMSFGVRNLPAGGHTVRIQWMVNGGEGFFGDRSIALSTAPPASSEMAQVFIAPPSDQPASTASTSFVPLPGMTVSGALPQNGEAAILFSGEVSAGENDKVFTRLVIEGQPVPDSEIQLTDSDPYTGIHSHLFSAKHLNQPGSPEASTLQLEWRTENGSTATIGDRSLVTLVKPAQVPDLADPIAFGLGDTGIEPAIGRRRLLVILFDPDRPGHAAPASSDIKTDVFGAAKSIRHYFQVVSDGKYTLDSALGNDQILGWYGSMGPWEDYFNALPACEVGGGNSAGQDLRRREAIQRAAQDVNLADWDDNRDGVLDPHLECGILIVSPDSGTAPSKMRRVHSADCGPLVVDGVAVPWIAEWLTDRSGDNDFLVAAHELAHLMLNLSDQYSTDINTGAFRLSLMDLFSPANSPHPDPVAKLGLGWARPTVVRTDGIFELEDVKFSGNEMLILPRLPGTETDEFYLLENRQSAPDHSRYDHHIFDAGIAVWHIIAGPESDQAPPCMNAGVWAGLAGDRTRAGIRVIRPGIQMNNTYTLWHNQRYNLFDGAPICPMQGDLPDDRRNVLWWSDWSASGWSVVNWSAAGQVMSFQIITP